MSETKPTARRLHVERMTLQGFGGEIIGLGVWLGGWHLRIWHKRWAWPYAWHKYGLYAIGGACFGINVFPPRKDEIANAE